MEVFPTLQLREELKSVLEFASIDRITMNRDRDFMRIYLESDKLIVKSCIFELEQAITGQLFPDAKMTVKVIERFHLSRQYTPQNLMPIYEESILLELKAYNALLYSLMHDSKKLLLLQRIPSVWRCRILLSQMERSRSFYRFWRKFSVSAAG